MTQDVLPAAPPLPHPVRMPGPPADPFEGLTPEQRELCELTGYRPRPSGSSPGEGTPDQPSSDAPPAQPQQEQELRDKLAAWMRASGAEPSAIAEELGLPDYEVTLLLSRTAVMRKEKQIKEEYWGSSMTKQFDLAAPSALKLAREMVEGDLQGLKPSERWSAAQWILEKSTGKPKQEVALSGDFTLRQLFSELDAMKQAREITDVTQTAVIAAPKESEAEKWIRENLSPQQEAK